MNLIYQREIERKFILNVSSYEEAYHLLLTKARINVNATSFDTYWSAPGVDFVRLRDNSREITVKLTDKDTIVDRIEENVEVYGDSMPAAKNLLTLLFGPPSLKLTKKFSVFTMAYEPAPGVLYKAVLCLYQIEGDSKRRVFFEIEAENIQVVDSVLSQFDLVLTLTPEKRSLYQVFMEEGLK